MYILFEKNYQKNVRGERLMKGISSVLKKKRIAVKTCSELEDIPEREKIVVLLGASMKWAEETVKRLNEKGVHPLLFGFRYPNVLSAHSAVTPDYKKAMYVLCRAVFQERKGEAAFIGYNSDSLPDESKLQGVRFAAEQANIKLTVFENAGDISSCIAAFKEQSDRFSYIVCANDGAALILKNLYPALLEGKTLCSCSGMLVSEYSVRLAPTTRIDYEKAGRKLAETYLFLQKSDNIDSTEVLLEMEVEYCGIIPPPPSELAPTEKKAVDFYGDQSIGEIENLERMLLRCDETDLKILKSVTLGEPYEEIADRFYFSSNAVKYRVHEMLKDGGFENRKQLLSALEKYGLSFEKV